MQGTLDLAATVWLLLCGSLTLQRPSHLRGLIRKRMSHSGNTSSAHQRQRIKHVGLSFTDSSDFTRCWLRQSGAEDDAAAVSHGNCCGAAAVRASSAESKGDLRAAA